MGQQTAKNAIIVLLIIGLLAPAQGAFSMEGVMATVEEVLDLARSQIGVRETPMGSNNVPYNQPGFPWSMPYDMWCAQFISWLFHKLGSLNLVHGGSAASVDFLARGRAAGEEVSIAQAQAGDIVIFDHDLDPSWTDHIGIIEKRLGPITFQTIEGNIHNQVDRTTQTENARCHMYFVRPKYSVAKPKEQEGELMAVHDDEGESFKFGNVWQERYGYWLHVYNCGKEDVEIRLGFWPQGKTRKDFKLANGFWVKAGESWNQDLVKIVNGPDYKIKSNFGLFCTSSGPVYWSLREYEEE